MTIDPKNQTIALASDHGAVELKASLAEYLRDKGFTIIDLGTQTSESVDYPDIAEAMAASLRAGDAQKGVLLCGTGIGISIAVNRHRDMRGALVHDVTGARLSRQHNDANILVMGGRTTGVEVARDCVDTFLSTEFEGGRHARRVAKMS